MKLKHLVRPLVAGYSIGHKSYMRQKYVYVNIGSSNYADICSNDLQLSLTRNWSGR